MGNFTKGEECDEHYRTHHPFSTLRGILNRVSFSLNADLKKQNKTKLTTEQ